MNGMPPIMSCRSLSFMFSLLVACVSCDSQSLIKRTVVLEVEKLQKSETVTPIPTLIRRSFNLSLFYKKYLSANGLPIVSSEKVADEAFFVARDIVIKMVEKEPQVLKNLISQKIRLAIMARTEVTTDIPEHSDLFQAFPGTDWNKRARGLGPTLARPACSVSEENLLGYNGDPYRGESILIHEFSHAIHQIGINLESFNLKLTETYQHAIKSGLWQNAYAVTNASEYWAEGVQSWFDANLESRPADGIHNEINTRNKLKKYDPKLAKLMLEWFVDDDWRFKYPKL